MMRWVVFSIAVVAVAAIATVASTYLVAPLPTPAEVTPTAQEKPSGPPGSVVVDGSPVYSFGVMAQLSEGKHDWTITNKGTGPVMLSLGQPSCSCTIAQLKDGKTATLAPGESSKITLNWNTKTFTNKYRQTAPLLIANDPSNEKIEFAVEGEVQPAIQSMPAESAIDFLTVANDPPASRDILYYSKDRPETKVLPPETSAAGMFDVKVTDLTPDELKRIGIARGQKVTLTIKPGAPLGSFNEEVLLATDHPKRPQIDLHVRGKLIGPITVAPDRVRMLDVSSKAGGSQTLALWVRGKKDTKFTVEKKPPGFEVAVVPKGDPGPNNSMKYEVTVTLPPGTSKGGTITDEIILKTDHPQATEVKIPVAVLVHAS